MNMNRSGHSEMQAPDWYRRSTDRAKLSPNTLETESLQNSLTSLNFDSFTAAVDNDHFSVRSLPVMPSSSASIASAADAPWNESPRSLRGGSRSANALRASSLSGMSTLDHLQNSISSITRPPINIITEDEEDPLYLVEDTSTGADGEDLNGSLASVQLDGDRNTEMDATAHAGNSRSSRMVVTTTNVPPPISPMRSPMRSSSSRRAWVPPSPAHSYSGGVSIASRSSSVRRGGRAPVSDEASLSSILTDGDDNFIQEEDDDSLAIIKLLRNQVETLKSQLISEQEKNQQLKSEALQSKSAVFQMSYCSNSFNSLGHDCTSDADSFGGDDTSSKCGSSPLGKTEQVDKFTVAHTALANSVQALRQSWQQRSEATVPIVEDDNALMLDELTLCEIEGYAKTMQIVYDEQQLDWQAQRERWQSQAKRHESKIQELKRQLSAKKN